MIIMKSKNYYRNGGIPKRREKRPTSENYAKIMTKHCHQTFYSLFQTLNQFTKIPLSLSTELNKNLADLYKNYAIKLKEKTAKKEFPKKFSSHTVDVFRFHYTCIWNCECAQELKNKLISLKEIKKINDFPLALNPYTMYRNRLEYFIKANKEKHAFLQQYYCQVTAMAKEINRTKAEQNSPPMKRRQRIFSYLECLFCQQCFCNIFGISARTFRDRKLNYSFDLSDKNSICRPKIHNSLEEKKVEQDKFWKASDEYLEIMGQSQPDYFLKVEINEKYINQLYKNICRRIKENNLDVRCISDKHFYKEYREKLPQLVFRKWKKFGNCNTCYRLELYRRSVVKGSSDEIEYFKLHTEHMEEARTQREEAVELRRYAAANPDKCWFLMVDGLSQWKTALPREPPMKDSDGFGPWKTKLSGITAWGAPIGLAFFPSSGNVSINANHTITMLQAYFKANEERLIYMNNCGGPASKIHTKIRAQTMKDFECPAHSVSTSILPNKLFPVRKYSEDVWRTTQLSVHEFSTSSSDSEAELKDSLKSKTKKREQRKKLKEKHLKFISDFNKAGPAAGFNWPKRLVLQMDNSGKENKNRAVFLYLGLLVAKGYFERIDLIFLVVGHTHDLIDQVFSVVEHYLDGGSCWTQSILNTVLGHVYSTYEHIKPSVFWLHRVINFDGKLCDDFGKHLLGANMMDFHRYVIQQEDVLETKLYVEDSKIVKKKEPRKCVTLKGRSFSEKLKVPVSQKIPVRVLLDDDLRPEVLSESGEYFEDGGVSEHHGSDYHAHGETLEGSEWERRWILFYMDKLPDEKFQFDTTADLSEQKNEMKDKIAAYYSMTVGTGENAKPLMHEQCQNEWTDFFQKYDEWELSQKRCPECVEKKLRQQKLRRDQPSIANTMPGTAEHRRALDINKEVTDLHKEMKKCMKRNPLQHEWAKGWGQLLGYNDPSMRGLRLMYPQFKCKQFKENDGKCPHCISCKKCGNAMNCKEMLKIMPEADKKCQCCGESMCDNYTVIQKNVAEIFRNVKDPFVQNLRKSIAPQHHRNLLGQMGCDEDTQAALSVSANPSDMIKPGEYFFQFSLSLFEELNEDTVWESQHPFHIFMRCKSDSNADLIAHYRQQEEKDGDILHYEPVEISSDADIIGVPYKRAASVQEKKEWKYYPIGKRYAEYKNNPIEMTDEWLSSGFITGYKKRKAAAALARTPIDFSKCWASKRQFIDKSFNGQLSIAEWFLLYEVRNWEWGEYTSAQMRKDIEKHAVQDDAEMYAFCKVNTSTIFYHCKPKSFTHKAKKGKGAGKEKESRTGSENESPIVDENERENESNNYADDTISKKNSKKNSKKKKPSEIYSGIPFENSRTPRLKWSVLHNLITILHASTKTAARKKLVILATQSDKNYNVQLANEFNVESDREDNSSSQIPADDTNGTAIELSLNSLSVNRFGATMEKSNTDEKMSALPVDGFQEQAAAANSLQTSAENGIGDADEKQNEMEICIDELNTGGSHCAVIDIAHHSPMDEHPSEVTDNAANKSANSRKRHKSSAKSSQPSSARNTRRNGKNAPFQELVDNTAAMRKLHPDHFSGIDANATTAIVLDKKRGRKRK